MLTALGADRRTRRQKAPAVKVMLPQFGYAYLRQSALTSILCSADCGEQTDRSALAWFAAAARPTAIQAASIGHSHKNGKHHPNDVSLQPTFVRELAQELERLQRHVTAYVEGLWLRLIGLVEELQDASKVSGGPSGAADAPERRVDALRQSCDSLGAWPMPASPSVVLFGGFNLSELSLPHQMNSFLSSRGGFQ